MSDVLFGFLWGAGSVVAIWLAWKLLPGAAGGGAKLSLRSLITGKDKRFSLSKFQASVWFLAIFFGYVATYAVRARYGDVSALGELPENLMYLLAFTTGGALGAKWLTASRVSAGTLDKTEAEAPSHRDLIADDNGYPAWNKLQLFYFTILALGIFTMGLVEELRLAAADSPPMLPNIDTTLLVLMGVSQGGYLGKKAVSDR